MKKLLLFAGIIAILINSSCTKDYEPGGGLIKVLKKVTETADGKTTVYNLSYDAGKRLVSIISADNTEAIIFTYDATGNLIKIQDTDPYSEDIRTYTYANGIPVSGTYKSWRKITSNGPNELLDEELMTYVVANNQVTKIHVQLEPSVAADYNLSYSNGNLAKIELSDGTDYYKSTFTYGVKKPAFPEVSKFVLNHEGPATLFCSKNELLTATYDSPGTVITSTTQYTYNENGYVLTADDGHAQRKFDYQ